MGHEIGQFIKDWLARQDAELICIVDALDETSSMASPGMHDGLSDTNISTY